MPYRVFRVSALGLLLAGGPVTVAAQPIGAAPRSPAAVDSSVAESIRSRLEAWSVSGQLAAQGAHIHARNALPAFYLGRRFRSAWTSGGRARPDASGLVQAIRAGTDEGLDPSDYHLELIEGLMARAEGSPEVLPPGDLADLEILLSDAFLIFGSHLLSGRVNPRTIDPAWLANRRDTDMSAELDRALAGGGIARTLDALRPSHPGYERLRNRLRELRGTEAAGGWGSVAEGMALHEGDRDARIPALRRRLTESGDFRPPSGRPATDSLELGAELSEAVRAFQERHGLEPDGVVGRLTFAALNASAGERIRQVVVNLERLRWLPDELGSTHIRVNIAAATVEVWERNETVLSLRAVVGRQYRQTPSFTGSMTYLVLAPYWNVPPTIAAVDKLPLIKADPGYLAQQRMTLFDLATNQPVDPFSVDWGPMTGAQLNSRFRIRQDPGPLNALGEVKFMFPNEYNVYLHDTPSRELFAQAQRNFSSGCIRIEDPLRLARFLLRADPQWTEERMREVIAAGRERTVHLPAPVPIHLLYWTAFVDDEGRIHFREDVYQRDQRVWEALLADPPGP